MKPVSQVIDARHRRLSLERLERAMWRTDVRVDERWVGEHDRLAAEHRHDLGVPVPGPASAHDSRRETNDS